MRLIQFLVTPTGRALRVAACLALVATGVFVLEGTAGYTVATIGLLPIAAATLDLCLAGPLFGTSVRGADIRGSRYRRS